MNALSRPQQASITRPVFILGAHKSGTSLVRSLLDGHPALFVVPFEAHFFQTARFWVDYRLRKSRPPVLSFSKAKEAYTELVEHYNSITDALSDANLVAKIDVGLFAHKLKSTPASSWHQLFAQYIDAIHVGLFGVPYPSRLRVVEKSVENAEFAIDLVQMFPDARFVHVLRNPYSNLVALRRHVGRTRYPFLGPSLQSLSNSFYHLYRNRRLIEDYLVVRYEDVLLEPERTLRTIADFLEIDFVESMLSPMCMREPWTGNSSRGIKYSGISSANLDRWLAEINDLETYFVTRHFQFLLEDYQYEVLEPRHSRFWPVRGERPKVYLLNRVVPRFV